MRRTQRRARNREQVAAEERLNQAVCDAERAMWKDLSRGAATSWAALRRQVGAAPKRSQQDPIRKGDRMRERNRRRWLSRFRLT